MIAVIKLTEAWSGPTALRPAGVMEGMLAGTRVLTLEGACPVEYLPIGTVSYRVPGRAG